MKMKKTLLSLAMVSVLGFASASASAEVMLDFIVNETSAAPSITIGANTFGDSTLNADELNGSYVELFTATSASTFVTSAYWQGASFSTNEGVTLITPSTNGGVGSGLNITYGLYAIFSATGTYAADGTFTGTTAAITFYIDPTNNTTISFLAGDTGFSTPTVTNGADDYVIATSSSLVDGDGNLSTGLANGNFDIVFGSFTLTDPDGTSYFVSPDPFYLTLDLSGQFVEFIPGGTSELTGTADGHFAVPEPASLALLGLGLLGMGLAKSRRHSA